MKKTYIIPEMATMNIAQCLPIAESLRIGETVNEVEGDVKQEADWDIWDED